MDGLKFVIPETCHEVNVCVNQKEIDRAKEAAGDCPLFPDETVPFPEPIYEVKECPGCASGDHSKHTGIYAKIRDWGVWDNDHKDKNVLTGKQRCDTPFIDVVTKKKK